MQRQIQLEKWYASEEGSDFSSCLQETLRPHVERAFGYCAVQAGYSPTNLLADSPIKQSVVTGQFAGDIQCESNYLPIDSNSIDLLILSHALEISSDPYATLREAERVLVPEGKLFIVGFTPFSISGAWQKLVTEDFQRYTSVRVRDWLGVLGFDCVATQKLMRKTFHQQYQRKVPKLGLSTANYVIAKSKGCGYIIQAKKRVTRLTPVRQTWVSKRPRVRPVGVIKPSAQVARERWRLK